MIMIKYIILLYMSSWTQEFNSSFFLSIAGIVFASIGACFAYMYKSKCKHIKLCGGLIDVERDIQAELDDAENPVDPNLKSNIPTTVTVEEPQRRSSIRRSFTTQEIDDAVKRSLSIVELNKKDSSLSIKSI